MTRKRLIYLYFSLFTISTFIFLQSCKKENVKAKFYSDAGAGNEYYLNHVYPILTNKCFSCHNYHNSESNRYDTYSKAASNAEEMANRTNATDANIMPPVSWEPLTEEEKEIFKSFYELVEGGTISQEYKVSISWTAYKFPDSLNRAAVTGTFDDIFINYKNEDAADIYEYLKDAEAIINSNSVNVNGDQLKNLNLRNYFFSMFSPVIYCRVTDISPDRKIATVNVTMNRISHDIRLEISEQNENLVFIGTINNLNRFDSESAIDFLQKACGAYHKNTIWPDIGLKAEIRNYRNFAGKNPD